MQVSTRSSRFRRLSPLLCTRTSSLGDFNVEWCTVLISSPRQVLQHQIITPADTLDDTDADANTGNGARDSTLPFRHLKMCVAVRLASCRCSLKVASTQSCHNTSSKPYCEGVCGGHYCRWDTSWVHRSFALIERILHAVFPCV